MIINCGTPTEKVSRFFRQPFTTYNEDTLDSGDFINKIWRMVSIPGNALLVTADVTALYPSIPHDVGLKVLREISDKREQRKIFTEELVQMAEFVLKKTSSNLMVKLSSRSQEQPLELNVPENMLVYIWIRWKGNFGRSKSINLFMVLIYRSSFLYLDS